MLSDNPLNNWEDRWQYIIAIGIIVILGIALICAAICLTTAARASIGDNDDRRVTSSRSAPKVVTHRATHRAAKKRTRVAAKVTVRKRTVAEVHTQTQVVGGRPPECNITFRGKLIRWCMCALQVKLWGRVKPDLNLAANWPKRFPRANPAPGMVAARPGHGFQLLSHVRGNVWKVWDANTNGGLILIHERSIAGYTVVNPHASRVAMAVQ